MNLSPRVVAVERALPTRGVVEIIGPAGAGKSALLRALAARTPSTRCDLSLWGLPRSDQAVGALRTVTATAGMLRDLQPPPPSELGHMIRIEALERVARRALRGPDGLLVMDEGPLFGLAWLRVFHGSRGGRARVAWHLATLERWAALIDLVVHLDAPNAILAARIRSRRKPHPMRHASTASLDEFADAFRRAFDGVLRDLTALAPVTVTRLSTDPAMPRPGALAADRLTAVGSRD